MVRVLLSRVVLMRRAHSLQSCRVDKVVAFVLVPILAQFLSYTYVLDISDPDKAIISML